jgi:hypothetical protein
LKGSAMIEQTEVRSLDERRIEIAEKIAAGIEGRLRGGPDLKAEALALIDGLAGELDAEAIEEWKGQVAEDWDRVNAQVLAKPRVLGLRGLGPKPKPKPEPEAGPDAGPQINAALNVSAKPDYGPQAEPDEEDDEPAFKPEPKPKRKYSANVFVPAPLPPSGASALERLTYPRGLVGHVTQYMIDTNALPDRWMALAGALCVCGKALDRKVLGPDENSVVLFILVLAESGAGKNHILNCIKTILKAVDLESVFLGTGIASTQSVEEALEGMGGEGGNPSTLIEIDEYGSFLNRISSKSQSGNVAEIPGILCSLWGHSPQASWKGSIKVKKKMIQVHGPAFSIFGASTEPAFYRALKSRQISGGFVSRHLVFNAGRGAERRVEAKYSWVACPKWLRKALKEVAGPPAPLDNSPKILGQFVAWDWRRIGWGPAKERWYDYEYKVRSKPSGEERDVWIRVPEMALRLATIVAVFRGAEVVDLEDLEWAVGVAEHSATQIVEGLGSHYSEDMEQVELIRLVRAKLQHKGTITKGLLFKICENKTNDQRKIWGAINHLVALGEAVEIAPSAVGRPTEAKWKWNRMFEER